MVRRAGASCRLCEDLARTDPRSDLVDDVIGHRRVLGGMVEEQLRALAHDVVRLDPERAQAIENRGAGRLVASVDDQHPRGGAIRQCSHVDGPKPGQRLHREDGARLHDAGPLGELRRLGHGKTEQLQLADVAASPRDRRPGDDGIRADRRALRQGQRAADAQPDDDQPGDAPPAQGVSGLPDVPLPRLQAGRVPLIARRIPRAVEVEAQRETTVLGQPFGQGPQCPVRAPVFVADRRHNHDAHVADPISRPGEPRHERTFRRSDPLPGRHDRTELRRRHAAVDHRALHRARSHVTRTINASPSPTRREQTTIPDCSTPATRRSSG